MADVEKKENGREVVIPKWALTAFLFFWGTFVGLYVPWGIWVTSSLYGQSTTMQLVAQSLDNLDKRVSELVSLKNDITTLNNKVDTLTKQLQKLEGKSSP